jgi:alpha,alpha-trehalase
MSSPPAHGGKPADGRAGQDTRQRVGSLAAVNADSLSALAQHTVKGSTSTSPSKPVPGVAKDLPSHLRKSSGAAADLDPYSASHIYYGASHNKRNVAKARTYSAVSRSHALFVFGADVVLNRSIPVLARTLCSRLKTLPRAV